MANSRWLLGRSSLPYDARCRTPLSTSDMLPQPACRSLLRGCGLGRQGARARSAVLCSKPRVPSLVEYSASLRVRHSERGVAAKRAEDTGRGRGGLGEYYLPWRGSNHCSKFKSGVLSPILKHNFEKPHNCASLTGRNRTATSMAPRPGSTSGVLASFKTKGEVHPLVERLASGLVIYRCS